MAEATEVIEVAVGVTEVEAEEVIEDLAPLLSEVQLDRAALSAPPPPRRRPAAAQSMLGRWCVAFTAGAHGELCTAGQGDV